MKRLAFLFLVNLFAVGGFAEDSDLSFACRLTGGDGPFKSFAVRDGQFVRADWAESAGVVEGYKAEIKRRGPERNSGRRTLYFETSHDFGAGEIILTEDDNGKVAFVHFWSDGPSVTGYYRCGSLR